ncbi:beta-1,3-galactosyltransferase 1-like [Penaeus japonicus]|uniref:beta-1,3-galactosyltransferase 1-like n=1 Tax=Penaeus japonicus TaxID=27405 RepID=UPI001C70CD58|nr:beta-1,3-galactosyltransferase 1-like [Penaeus japonicus]
MVNHPLNGPHQREEETGQIQGGPKNLSYKTIAWLSWAVAHCTDVPYVLKVDDDVVVNPFNLQRFYHEINKQAAPNTKKEHTTVGKIYGRVIYALPQRKGRWALTKEEYPEETFPPYTTGAAYIIDRESVTQLWNHVPFVSVLWIEDVFLTGLVARAAELRHVGINHLYLENFTSISLYEGKTIFLFEASPSDIQSSWDRIINKTKH